MVSTQFMQTVRSFDENGKVYNAIIVTDNGSGVIKLQMDNDFVGKFDTDFFVRQLNQLESCLINNEPYALLYISTEWKLEGLKLHIENDVMLNLSLIDRNNNEFKSVNIALIDWLTVLKNISKNN